MSQPIPPISFPQNASLCSTGDVNALLSALLQTYTPNQTLVANAITAAQEQLQNRVNRPLVPTRVQQPIDGNGRSRMVLPYAPVLGINSVAIYYNYPLALTRNAHEYDFNLDRKRGVISFPPFAYSAAVMPYAFLFWKSSMNIQLDYVVGWTRSIQSEALATSDHLTYAFANTAVRQSTGIVPSIDTAPVFTPTIYVDGVAQTNTVYVQTSQVSSDWEIASDSLAYTVNYASGGGIANITFPSSQAGHAVTAGYSYSYTPADLRDACAKLAAITVLNATAIAPYGEVTMGGMTSVAVNGFKTMANDRGQYGPQIQSWEDEVAATVAAYKPVNIPTTLSFNDSYAFGRY